MTDTIFALATAAGRAAVAVVLAAMLRATATSALEVAVCLAISAAFIPSAVSCS